MLNLGCEEKGMFLKYLLRWQHTAVTVFGNGDQIRQLCNMIKAENLVSYLCPEPDSPDFLSERWPKTL